jgi:xanthine dehydrogenase accessory factor
LLRAPVDANEPLGSALHDALRRDKSALLESPRGEIFIDVFNPPLRVVVIGAVHVAQAMLPLAAALGHDMIIIDPRAAFATKERFGDAALINDWPDEVLPKIGVDARTAIVALAHEPRIDDPALIQGLHGGALYVGALGSKKTHASRVERLREAGITPEQIARIHAPIGLDIGAQGPSEIALSIIAEITAVQRGKDSVRS